MSIIMWEAAMSYASTLKFRMKHHWSKTPRNNKLRALLRRVFPNYISFDTMSLISASKQKLPILC